MHLNFQTTTKWTCCSNADFKALYDAGQADCLVECTDAPTTPTPPGDCGSPNFHQDGYCDDDNNNPGCHFDGGDCCPPYENVTGGWDQFCSSCECLEPTGNTTSITTILTLEFQTQTYSQVPIKQVGPNKQVGWIF